MAAHLGLTEIKVEPKLCEAIVLPTHDSDAVWTCSCGSSGRALSFTRRSGKIEVYTRQ